MVSRNLQMRSPASRTKVRRAPLGRSPAATALRNLRVRLFSVTVRTTFSGTPVEKSASISSVTFSEDPTNPER